MRHLLFHVAVESVQVESVGWAGVRLLTQDFSEKSEKKLHHLTAGHEHDQFLPTLKLCTYKQSSCQIHNSIGLLVTIQSLELKPVFDACILYLAFGQNE